MKNTSECAIFNAIEILEGKWSMQILRTLILAKKSMRFGELQRELTVISPRSLSAKLKELEEFELVSREQFDEMPLRVEYALTKKSEALIPVMQGLGDWYTNHIKSSEIQ